MIIIIILPCYYHFLETLAMKALNMNALKRKKEAFDFIKLALFKNLGNFTCWHVFGILHRSNKYIIFIVLAVLRELFNFRNYDEARKAYLNALRHDAKN